MVLYDSCGIRLTAIEWGYFSMVNGRKFLSVLLFSDFDKSQLSFYISFIPFDFLGNVY